jgi:GTP1/Obg family GTP-binding protein
MFRTALSAVTLLVVTTSIASANSIDDRQLRQYGRIEEGREDGSITWREGLRLRTEQHRIATLEEALKDRHGHLTKRNWRFLHRLQNDASEHIEAAKDNDHYRPTWLPRVGR